MSTEIEQRVVEMQFDNKHFERNVSTTMSSLDKLKEKLNLTGAAKGLENVGTAARGINLSGLTGAAETVGLKFNAMWTIADQALRNITNSAMAAGKRITSALTVDPIKTGFSEYETQINAVQTILANTKSKGTTIGDVNAALDELNTYADKTIYNFTEMTRNIGTFTAAGVDLDKSVTSIKGIANLAAVSGSTSQQASTAMYQLSQALAAGKVSLMDWNSVVNAGMGGEVFQNALKRTAENMGTNVDALIKKYGSFRESLTQGEWLTADVLTETLTQLSGAYTEADLLAQGYTKEQAKDILELAATAESAATDVKTFTQLWDTLKESAQSGWTQTWEILIGDFEEAKALFSEISKVIGKMIGDSAEARNNLLQGWKDAGGRADLLDGFKNIFTGLMNIVRPIKEAFRNIFPPTTVKQLVSFTESFKNLTGKFVEFTEKHGDKIRSTFEGIFSVVDIGWTFVKKLAGGIINLLGNFKGLAGGILGASSTIGDWLKSLRDTVKETDIFGTAIDKIVGFLGSIIDKLKAFGAAVKSAFQSPGAEGFFDILRSIWNIIVKIGSKIGEIFKPLGEAISNVFNNASLSDILNDGIFAAILVGIYKFVDNLNGPLGSIKDLFEGIAGEDGILGGVKETLDSVRGCFEAYQQQLQAGTLIKIATAIGILAASIFVLSSIDDAALDRSLGAIGILFAELLASLAIFTKMNFGTKGMVKGVSAINGLAAALLVLAVAMKIMSTMSWEEIAVGITGTVAGLGALVGAVNLLPEKNVIKSSKAIGKLATALVILAAGMKIMASMSWEELAVGITGTVAGLGALVGAVNLLPKDAGLRTLGIMGLATSMVILGGALKIMGSLNWDELKIGLAAMGGSLFEIVTAVNLLPKDAALRTLGMIGLATAMVILGAALKNMGGMTWDEIGRGLSVMGLALIELAVALNFMKGTLSGSAALLVAAGALAIMAPVLKLLGGMSWESIGKGLVALAGAFAIVGIAGLLLAPVTPAILALAGAMALLGISTLGIGAGLTLISVGISAITTALSAGATVIVAGIAAIINGIVDLIPNVILGLGDAILALCTVIVECAPAIVETFFVLISEICTTLATYVPVIGNALFDLLIGALDILAARMPELIASAVNVISAFFTGIADALSGMETSGLLKGIVGFALVTALAYALSGIAALIPAAMVGVLGIGVLIAELAIVLAAIGALAQIPGLSWLIEEGGDLMQQIGIAIGKFVGGIIGGIAEGATSTLPQVGTNLSNFMTNLQPFVTGMQSIDQSVIDKSQALAGAILTLTAADLLSSITSFISGGQSIGDFGTELAAFGTAMRDFAAEVEGVNISPSVVDSAKALAGVLMTLTAAEGLSSLTSFLPGGQTMGDFANDIVTFGKAMKDYSTEVNGVNTDAISTSVTAADELIKMASNMPSDGIFGTDGIDDFGENLVVFGECIMGYAKQVAGIDAEAITASVDAAVGLFSLADKVPDDGWLGTDGIDDFGDNIVDFGESMVEYADEVAGINATAITASVNAIANLVNTINSMSSIDASGVDNFTTALNKLASSNFDEFTSTFSASTTKLTNVGADMFNSIITGMTSAKSRLISTVRAVMDEVTTSISSRGIRFTVLGIETISKFINGILRGKSRVSNSFGSMLSAAVTKIRSYYNSFYNAGDYLVIGFARGISANTYKAVAKARSMAYSAKKAAEDELDINSPSRVGYSIGNFFGLGFVNAIADYTKKAYDTTRGMANSAKLGLREAFDKVGRIMSGEVEIQPMIRPVIDLTDVKRGADAINGMIGLRPSVDMLAHVNSISSMMNQRSQNGGSDEIVSAINRLQKALSNTGNTTNIINGITYDDGSNINEAIHTIAKAILIEGRI